MAEFILTENSEDANKISFIASIIPAFADAYKMKVSSAYDYLKNTED